MPWTRSTVRWFGRQRGGTLSCSTRRSPSGNSTRRCRLGKDTGGPASQVPRTVCMCGLPRKGSGRKSAGQSWRLLAGVILGRFLGKGAEALHAFEQAFHGERLADVVVHAEHLRVGLVPAALIGRHH